MPEIVSVAGADPDAAASTIAVVDVELKPPTLTLSPLRFSVPMLVDPKEIVFGRCC